MVVEVIGTLDRESGCYLAGESVSVSINITNLDSTNDDVLAWICLQLQCDRLFLRGGKVPEQSNGKGAKATTSVKLPKEAIYSSKPDIVLCNWNLGKGNPETRHRRIDIPLGFPPTFKGHFLRYNWHIRIAVQRIDKPIETLCLPLRILNSTVHITSTPVSSDENPFLRNEKNHVPPLFLALEQIEEKTSSAKRFAIYDVVSEGELFATVKIYVGPFKLGDAIQGFVEFPDAEEGKPTCIQMLARVETIEENLYSDHNNVNVTLQGSTQVTTAFMRGCHFRLPIKLTATPTFTEQSVKVTWRIHFEFTITRDTILTVSENMAQPVSAIPVQTLTLDHAFFVHSCNPYNVNLVVEQLASQGAIRI